MSEKNSVFRGITLNFSGTSQQAHDSIIDVLYKCTSNNWTLLQDKFSGLSDVIASTQSAVEHFNNFLGINIVYSPKTIIATSIREGHYVLIILALLVPILAALTQFLNIRLMPQAANNGGQQEAMASQMEMMNYMMPLYSVFIVFFLPVGVGIYWIAGAVFRGIQQVIVNKHMEKMDMDALIRKNVEKMNAKRKKQGLPPKKISEHAKVNFKDLEDAQKVDEKKQAERQKKIQDSTEYYKHADAKPGSIAAKARMVQQFDEKNPKGKKNKN